MSNIEPLERAIALFMVAAWRIAHLMRTGRTWLLWQKAGLQGPRKRPCRRVASQRDQVQRASEANGIWTYDFVFDTCANGQRCVNGQRLKCLTVIDEHTREALAIDVAGSIRSERVIEQ